MRLLRLFVYGSLKRGFSNHSRYCRGVYSVEPADLQGCLSLIPSGFPILRVDAGTILARGTADLRRDLAVQEALSETRMDRQIGTRTVQGEILSFADPVDRLRALDRLEGFEANRCSEYDRVLVPIFSRTCRKQIAVWTYVAGSLLAPGPEILSGRWNG